MSSDIQKYKYGRTFHLPWTGHKTTDDKIWDEDLLEKAFSGKEIIITEKMDGENTTVYDDGTFHARSIDGRWHPSRNRMVGIAKGLGAQLPRGIRICGENLYAKHSIAYENLDSFFVVFGIYDENNNCLSWDETEYLAKELELTLVPIMYRGLYDEQLLKTIYTGVSAYGGVSEGYVMRLAEGFPYEKYGECSAKFVRQNHVQTDEHWMFSKIIPNKLKGS
jgi:hypothetical protein